MTDRDDNPPSTTDTPAPAKLIFGSDSESRASTALSVPVEGVSRRQRFQRYLIRSILQSDLVKPIDTDSKVSFQRSSIENHFRFI